MTKRIFRSMVITAGAVLLATMHASGLDDLYRKPLWPMLRGSSVFARAIVIEGTGAQRRYRVEALAC